MVLHQDVAKIGQTALLLGAFAVKARILVRRRGDGLEKLEEQSPQKARSGGMDGRPIRSEGGRKSQVELSQRRIGQPPHRPQRGVPRDARLDVHLREQRPACPSPPHRSLAIRLRQSSKNHAGTTNTSSSSGLFFSSLLG